MKEHIPQPSREGEKKKMEMITLAINNTPIVMTKFFAEADSAKVLDAIPASAKKVLFVDTAATPQLVETVKALVDRGVEVVVRDHHRGEGRTPEAAEDIESVLGENAHIVDRASAPGCAMIVDSGEFADCDMIVADPDLDGLVAAMQAAGLSYDGMEEDARVFDVRPEWSEDSLSELGWTVVRAMATVPPFNKDRPDINMMAMNQLFKQFVAAAQGDESAYDELKESVATYEAAVAEAERLLSENMTHPCKGVVMVDAVGADRPDLNTLTRGMEDAGAMVTALRKDVGPIAGSPGGHGTQVSLAVVRKYQDAIDLRSLVPEGSESSPQAGLLSNTSFLLHCSEDMFNDTILPALSKQMEE